MKFTWSSGSRPLDGYTIKRGIGQGGFGEVYYAVSDGGKEVALKLIRSNREVELRGVMHCLNLKHPNLVALYDIRTDAQGDCWVIMEYVTGDSMSALLNRHPQGLSLDLVKEWFLSLARSVGYLHDNGLVHRDLKPGNIFIENGTVKVGDYGLSKFISGSQAGTAQTQSVGTVHYMAPEVSKGNYGKQVDIYAAGVILYEMLTGRVPFDGESTGEILMKHLTCAPDLQGLPSGYAEVVGTALTKDPALRYASMGDMARAVEQVGATPTAPAPTPRYPASPVVEKKSLPMRERVGELCGSLALSAVVTALLALLVWAAALNLAIDSAESAIAFYLRFVPTFCLVVFGSWAVMVPAKLWDQRPGDPWLRQGTMLLLGLALGALATWLYGWTQVPVMSASADGAGAALAENGGWPGGTMFNRRFFGYVSYFGVAFLLLRWWKWPERDRTRRFSFYPVFLAGLLGYLLHPIFWPDPGLPQGPVILTLTAAIVQIVSPWEQPVPKPARRLRLRYVQAG